MICTNLRANSDCSPLQRAAFEAMWSIRTARFSTKTYVLAQAFCINLSITAISVHGIHTAVFVMQYTVLSEVRTEAVYMMEDQFNPSSG